MLSIFSITITNKIIIKIFVYIKGETGSKVINTHIFIKAWHNNVRLLINHQSRNSTILQYGVHFATCDWPIALRSYAMLLCKFECMKYGSWKNLVFGCFLYVISDFSSLGFVVLCHQNSFLLDSLGGKVK